MYRERCRNKSNIVFHSPQSASSCQEQHLKQDSARAMSNTTDPLEKLRLLCLSRGACGILGLGRIFRRLEDDGSKQLNKEEFFHGIKESGLELSHADAEELFKKFDTHDIGSISLDEFLMKIRPPMSQSRRAIVEQAFRKLDRTGEGLVSVADIRKLYSLTAHPSYMNGDDTADAIFNKFLVNFETEGIENGTVTLEEFMDYYSGLGVSIDDDCFFDLMIRQSYKL